jgi:trimethylamine:corrinoid methyltransferase-like protein
MKEGLTGGMLNFLPNADLERIHFSSLSLLEDHGLFSESDMVLDLFAKGGAASSQARMIRLPFTGRGGAVST